jgi:hypothetical protein
MTDAVATLLPPDPFDDGDGPYFSRDDLKRMASLPSGTKLYIQPIGANESTTEALDRIFSYVSYVNIHGVGRQPEPNGLPQPMRVSPEEFMRIFQEIGKIASAALHPTQQPPHAGDGQ